MKRKLKIEPFRGEDGQWYFRIRGKNGEPLAVSEGYSSRAKMRRTATMLRDEMQHATIEGE